MLLQLVFSHFHLRCSRFHQPNGEEDGTEFGIGRCPLPFNSPSPHPTRSKVTKCQESQTNRTCLITKITSPVAMHARWEETTREDLGVDGDNIKTDLKKYSCSLLIGFIWLRVGTGGGFMYTRH
jgi:hypothetical protein